MGRRPSKFYRGRIPNANVAFIHSLKGNNPRDIQKEYHNKYGVWLKESTIEKTLNRRVATAKSKEKSVVVNTKSNKITVSVNYKGNSYTPIEYLEVREKEAKMDLFTALNA